MDGTTPKDSLNPDATDAGVTSSPEPIQETPAQAAEIVHTVAEPPATDQAQGQEAAPGVVHNYDPMAAAEAGPVSTPTPDVAVSASPDSGDGQGTAGVPTTLEQPTADLSQVGVGLGADSGTGEPAEAQNQTVSDPAVQAEGHGGVAEVSQIINTVRPEVPTTPVESKWGMEKAPSVEATVAEGLGSRIKRFLHLGGSNSPVKVTTSTVPAPEVPGAVQTPAETPAPTSNPV